MAEPTKPGGTPPPGKPTPDRRRDVEALAAAVYAQAVPAAPARGKTPEAVAREALDAARTFYKVCDDPTTNPQG